MAKAKVVKAEPIQMETADRGGVLYAIPTQQIWKCLPKESPQAYAAFQEYIAVKDENAGGVGLAATRLGKAPSLLNRWSQRWQWPDRYRALQNHRMLMQEREQANAMRAEAGKWARRRSRIRDVGYEMGELLIKRAELLLSLPVVEREILRTVTAKSGEEIAVSQVLNFQQHPRDARMFVDTAIKLMRLSADMSTENLAMLADETINLDEMDDAQLDAYAQTLLQLRTDKIEGTK